MDENNQNNFEENREVYDSQNMQAPVPDGVDGKPQAIASLVLGIVTIVAGFPGLIIIGLPTGIVGLILASSAKKKGFIGGIRTAGFVCSLIGLIINAIFLVVGLVLLSILGSAYVFDSFM